MAKYIVIERPNGNVTIVRKEVNSASEEPLTEHEQIINELFAEIKELRVCKVCKKGYIDNDFGCINPDCKCYAFK